MRRPSNSGDINWAEGQGRTIPRHGIERIADVGTCRAKQMQFAVSSGRPHSRGASTLAERMTGSNRRLRCQEIDVTIYSWKPSALPTPVRVNDARRRIDQHPTRRRIDDNGAASVGVRTIISMIPLPIPVTPASSPKLRTSTRGQPDLAGHEAKVAGFVVAPMRRRAHTGGLRGRRVGRRVVRQPSRQSRAMPL
jgi:hypothetical protein